MNPTPTIPAADPAAAAILRLDAFPWMPRRKAGAVTKALTRPSSGRPARDNAILAELRVRNPKIVKQHPPHGGKALNIALATQLRHHCITYHANLLGVAYKEIKLHNSGDLYAAAYYIQHGNADKLVRYLEGATCTVQAAPRPDGATSGLCGCGQPLDGNDRTYCKKCKSARNASEKQRRKQATAQPKSPRRSTARVHVPADAEHVFAPVQHPVPTVYPDRPATSVHNRNDQRITIIDFRPTAASDRPLTDQHLHDLAARTTRTKFGPTDGGRIGGATDETTDVAYAVGDAKGRVVVWVMQASAAVGYDSIHAHRAMRLSVDIGELLRSQDGPRARSIVLHDFIAAATTIAECSDMIELADNYQLSCEADCELSLAPKDSLHVNELLADRAIRPTTKAGWDIARGLLNNGRQFRGRTSDAITQGALIE